MNEAHSGNKYHRKIFPIGAGTDESEPITVDVYNVIEAFDVNCPGLQHAIKKLLCAGIRGKGGVEQDLTEAIDAISRSITLQKQRRTRKEEDYGL